MRQLIARIDESLHGRLKERAASEGRSLNALVTDLLRQGLARSKKDAGVLVRLERSGTRFIPPVQGRAPSRDAAIRATRGWGTAVSEALEENRSSR